MILVAIADAAVHLATAERVADCRDPGDDKYLELALAGQADVIVSSDRDLLDLDPWRGIPIVTPAGFLALAAYDSPGAR